MTIKRTDITFTRRMALLAMAGSAAQLAGCGGGGGGIAGLSSGGTGSFTSGTITGLGSIIVNGIRYDDTNATVTLRDGSTDSRTNLRLGMVVSVQGSAVTPAATVGGTATATAQRISYGGEWEGPVSAIDITNKKFTLLGQTVDILATTVFDGTANSLTSLSTAHFAEVYGYVDTATGHLQATRVETSTTQPSTYRLSGVVGNLTSNSFTLGDPTALATISFTASTVKPTNLSNGLFVQVTLPAQATGPWTATRIDAQYQPVTSLQVRDDDAAEIHGIVTSQTSPTSFNVNGIPVDARQTSVPSSLAVGVDVEIHGTVRNGVILASKVEVQTEAELERKEFEFYGTFSNLNTTAKTFTLKTYTFRYDSNTVFEGINWAVNTAPTSIKAKAVLDANGQLLATKVEADH